MNEKGQWTRDGIPLDSNGRELRPEWFCSKCAAWYAGEEQGGRCYMCNGPLKRVPDRLQWHLYKDMRGMDKGTPKREAFTLAAQVEYLSTQRRHLLGQVHAIDGWLKHLRAPDEHDHGLLAEEQEADSLTGSAVWIPRTPLRSL